MISNYIKVGLRNIARYKVFSFINVFGLAAAMSICMLIILMLADRDRYDQFHARRDRIYRILSNYEGTRMAYATSAMPVAAGLKSAYEGIEEATTLTPGVGGDVSYGEKVTQMRGYFAEPSFFKIFSFELERGDSGSALSAPRSVIISKTLAMQLFGQEDVIGKVVEFSDRQLPFPVGSADSGGRPSMPWGSFTVTGVMDMNKYVSHLKFDALVSASTLPGLYAEHKLEDHSNQWDWYYNSYTFVLLAPNKGPEALAEMLAGMSARIAPKIKSEEVKGFRLEAQLLGDVQLNLQANDTDERMPRIGYYFLSVLAAVIMVCACLNYTNLSIARALTRAKEIGVRKVTGAGRRSLIVQFLSESVIMAVLALLMAIGLLTFLKPAFQGLWVNQFLNFDLQAAPLIYLYFFAFAVAIGLLAGAYPAFHLSTYQPIAVLKRLDALKPGKLGLRKVLSVAQFVISLFFITTSILVFNQFKHYMTFDYGFKPENIVNVSLQGADARNLANEFSRIAGVSTISATDIIPASGENNGCEIRKPGVEAYTSMDILNTDEHFAANLGLKMIAGRSLPNSEGDTSRYILVNRQAAKTLGYADPRDIVGEVLEMRWFAQPVEVIGVVEDFRSRALINKHDIKPLVMRNRPSSFMFLNVKVASPDLMATVAQLEAIWKRVDNVHPFKYRFFDEQLAAMHRGIFDMVSVLGFIAVLAIIISCLGLLGMATYTAERKRKEVGIRKVLGAPSLRIALSLSRELMIVLAIAIVIGAPLSYVINNMWLQTFPNRVDFGFGTVTAGALTLLVLGFFTIGSQTLRASRSNPVYALKEE